MTVVFLPDYTDTNPYQEKLKTQIEALGERVVLARERVFLPVLRSVLGRDDVTVAHVHWLDPYVLSESLPKTLLKFTSTLLELLVLRLLGVAIVWTCHNVKAHETPYPSVEYWFKRIAVGAGLFDQVFVHCEATKDDLLAAYDLDETETSRMTVVPHGHYVDCYENAVDERTARMDLGLRDTGTVFLFFGLIRPYKNCVPLIEAFEQVAKPEDRLVIAGNPSDEAVGRRVHDKASGDDRVLTFLRFVPTDRIQVYMNAADVVVLPLEDITMSGSAILAQSFGVALILPRIGCMPEVIGDEGAIMYDPEDPDGLKDALASAHGCDLDSMGAYNGRLARQRGWTEAAKRTVEVYRELTDFEASPKRSPATGTKDSTASNSPEK